MSDIGSWLAIGALGLSLGLLGGGGSLLAVPILLYGFHLAAPSAIAGSLLVVLAASAAALGVYAARGSVRWRLGLTFAAVSAIGAYAAGRVAAFVPPWLSLTLLVAAMLVTAVSMLRRGTSNERTKQPGGPPRGRVVRDAMLVGILSGLVGAGGGFVVVPALVLLGGLGMREAVGTSLLVIAVNCAAGFLGHVSHAAVDWPLAGRLAALAAVSAVAGGLLAHRASTTALRKAFGWLTLGVALFTLYRELPAEVRTAFFEARWPFWAGGLGIGIVVLLLLWRENRALGVSTGYLDACSAVTNASQRRSWRLPFLVGIIGGGVVAGLLSSGASVGAFAAAAAPHWMAPLWVKAVVFTGGGVLLGFGARVAGGCTSGHGIVGVAQGARASIVSTAAFLVAGLAVTNLLFRAF